MKTLAVILCISKAIASLAAQPPDTTSTATANATGSETSPAAILATMRRVADWQLAHPIGSNYDSGEQGWTYCALYAGIMALDEIAGTPKYLEAMIAMGAKFKWQPAPRPYHADDQCVAQIYLELYLRRPDRAKLRPTKERFDFILAHPVNRNLRMGVSGEQRRWSWCDALFMAPPAWIRLYQATGERRYLDFMDREWWATSDLLYDRSDHLFFRDSSYLDKREANGTKVFWSRGNGWVMAGLARVLPLLPADHPHRKLYEQQFKDMAARIASLQQPDGLWHPSLLDPGSFPLKEASGSGFFTFALAWGINNGLLDRAAYEPVVRRAWKALVECVTLEGKLEHVQPVGADPRAFDPGHAEVFGAGAFLLAGREMYRLTS